MGKDIRLKKEMGLFTATTLVAGNMIGSGIFMLPATLALAAGPGSTLLAWALTGIGSIFLALSFANLGSKIPKTGGPYEYSKMAFGNFMGFMNAWLYWNASWIGNAAIITSIGSYTARLIPAIGNNGFYAFLYTSTILWVFTILNIKGVKEASLFQACITVFKLALFVLFVIVAGYYFNPHFLKPMFPAGKGISTLPLAAASTLWAFTGFETATVTAEEIKNPERNIKLSTIFGISIAVVTYMAISFCAMGAMPQMSLAKSNAPLVEILEQFLGTGVSKLLLIACIISVFGTIIGWLLTTARMSYAAGVDKVFPEAFSKLHPKYRTPYVSLIINSILTNILLLMNYSNSLISAFNFMILLATLAYLPVYASTSAAEILLLVKGDESFNVWKFIKGSTAPLLGFAYAVWAIYGSGPITVMYGFLLMLFGVPFYIYMKIKNESKQGITINEKNTVTMK
ncbi:arginine/agmatine antiporter [Clostridium acetireducens DSM 10703]|jgi:APA family basic amino acid/polyamine antiporter|uniref:Arginine/agmatine antiporter n=1 Tax=Clostridium acetireducens DSM 10703 TaxID=1121290 RepID=A0A1E8EXE9_9CLOT|nr:amino acid permease [Clostridium acetireducens]OFI05470.1 arginine/agmatine antiporter [Clostridium acetireducens DSM 10703]